MNLSPHFRLSEMTRTGQSGFALEQGNPPTLVRDALTRLCIDIMEPIRARFGPVSVHSGYRSPELNAATHGASKTSQHMRGEACDFHCPNATLQAVFDWIRFDSGLSYSQLILEGHGAAPTWIHIALPTLTKHGEALVFSGGKYTNAPAGRLA